MMVDTSIPTVATPGGPDGGDDITIDEALAFVEDITGIYGYILTTKPVIGFGG